MVTAPLGSHRALSSLPRAARPGKFERRGESSRTASLHRLDALPPPSPPRELVLTVSWAPCRASKGLADLSEAAGQRSWSDTATSARPGTRNVAGYCSHWLTCRAQVHDRHPRLICTADMQAPSPPLSNRQKKKRRHILERDDRKRRRRDGQQKIRAENNLVETEAHFWYVQPACPPRDRASLVGKDREEATKRVLHRIQHTKAITNVAILNPNYKEGTETPRYAAIRLSEVISEEDQARLSKLI
jgi:hypothetical protein